jgi:hypothetical protein
MSSNNVWHLITKIITTQQHCSTLHHTSSNYTSLHFAILHTSPNYTSLHFTLHHTSPKYTSLHFAILHTSPHFAILHTSPHFTQLHFTTLHYTSHFTTLHPTTLHLFTSRCILRSQKTELPIWDDLFALKLHSYVFTARRCDSDT